jgi:aspartyl-tRNA(Asn)/glutamyl-tRNA(Gln) amidotransferase subunit A
MLPVSSFVQQADGKMDTLLALAAKLAAGTATSRDLIEECLARASGPEGEGARVFTAISAANARAAADGMDRLRQAGAAPSPFAGIPIGVKDLFDIAGEVTTAGSRVLAANPPAEADACAVARLRAAGFVILGRTNMTEFAYSGLGLNAHFGTPRNPFDRSTGRIPGGSSSGAAVGIADGMFAAGLGTDTGGSCRIPAALCGIVGFKPTAQRVPREGVVPLSSTLDSVGPLARSVDCCAILDAILSGGTAAAEAPFPLAGLRLGLPDCYVAEGMDDAVAAAFERAVSNLSAAGAKVVTLTLDMLKEIPGINAKGGLVGAEAYAWHRQYLERSPQLYDPWVLQRFEAGRSQSAADYIATATARRGMIARVAKVTACVDAVMMPTVPIVAPAIAAMAGTEVANRTNLFLLRNPSLANFLDRCAISLPCHRAGEPPVGLMLLGEHGADRRLLAMARAVADVVPGKH